MQIVLLTVVASWGADLPAQRNHIGNARPSSIAGGASRTFAVMAASDGTHGVELWRSDGTSSGTTMILDIDSSPTSTFPSNITHAAAGTFFAARTGSGGRELYFTDGTASGTNRVRDIFVGVGSSNPAELTPIGSKIAFAATDGFSRALWESDGLTASPVAGVTGDSPYHLTPLGSRVFYAATHPTLGTELFFWDSTSGLTTVVDIELGAQSSTPAELTEFSGWIYFSAQTANNGRELWRSDGTTTALVADIAPGSAGSHPDQLEAGSAHVAFTARAAGTRQLFRIDAAPVPTLTQLGSITAGHTISELTAGHVRPAAVSEPTFWFRVDDPTSGVELWRTTPAGSVVVVHDVASGAASSHPTNLRAVGDALLFRADDGATGQELWHTDGTTLTSLGDIKTGTGPSGRPKSSLASRPELLGTAKLLFAAERIDHGIELWCHDLSFGATVQLPDIDGGPPLPELFLGRAPGLATVEVCDAPRSMPAFIGISVPGALAPWPLPWVFPGVLRGAVMIDFVTAGLAVGSGFTSAAGDLQVNFPVPAVVTVPVAFQAFVLTGLDAESVVASNNGVCEEDGCVSAAGADAEAYGCADDDTGEYQINVHRKDQKAHTAYVALVRVKPTGELLLLGEDETGTGDAVVPIEAGQVIDLSGRVDFFTPVAPADGTMNADKLQLRLFDEHPSASTLHTGCIVWESYC